MPDPLDILGPPPRSYEYRGRQHLRDGTIGYGPRGDRTDDCLASALATVLQIPIEELPDFRLDERLASGEHPVAIDKSAWRELHRWLADRQLRMIVHRKVPARRRRWIGIVPMRGWFESHCLVMTYGELLFDPSERPDPCRVPLAVLAGVPAPPWARARARFKERHVRYGLSFTSIKE